MLFKSITETNATTRRGLKGGVSINIYYNNKKSFFILLYIPNPSIHAGYRQRRDRLRMLHLIVLPFLDHRWRKLRRHPSQSALAAA